MFRSLVGFRKLVKSTTIFTQSKNLLGFSPRKYSININRPVSFTTNRTNIFHNIGLIVPATRVSVIPKQYVTNSINSTGSPLTSLTKPVKSANPINDETYENTERGIDFMRKNLGLKYFLGKVYGTAALGFGGALVMSIICSPIALSVLDNIPALLGMTLGSLVGSIVSIRVFSSTEPKYQIQKVKVAGHTIETKIPLYMPSKKWSFAAISVCTGIMISPMVGICGLMDPTLIIKAVGLTTGVMAGTSLWALHAKSNKLLAYQSIAGGLLGGLVGVGLTSVAILLIAGADSSLFQLLDSVDVYGGLVLFTGLSAMTTLEAIQYYKTGKPDYMEFSVGLFLQAMNIFIRILEILAKSRSSRRK